MERMKNILPVVAFVIVLLSCAGNTATTPEQVATPVYIQSDTLEWFDSSRNRKIPIAVFSAAVNEKNAGLPVIIFSHGYGQNKGGDNFAYSYLTDYLSQSGYFVVSIQHELPTDDLLPMEGDPRIVRRSNWERGAENILFVLNELKKTYPDLNYNNVSLVGHSNGGDMSVLFTHQHPELINKLITMDHRRMPLPRIKTPKIYTLRSNDFPADEGVLPSEEENKSLGITIQLVQVSHNTMDDDGTEEERTIMRKYILEYLKD
jgi:pimeloyl-ACP methyl ester carboxylesterase